MSNIEGIKDWSALGRAAGYDARELARACGVPPRRLERHFMRKFSLPPQTFLDRLRMNDAHAALLAGKLIKAIAIDLHFADVTHFYHHFKRHFGCPPAEFRRRQMRGNSGGGGVNKCLRRNGTARLAAFRSCPSVLQKSVANRQIKLVAKLSVVCQDSF